MGVVGLWFLVGTHFQPKTRAYYDLDGLWVKGPRIPLSTFGVIESEDSEEESSSEDLVLFVMQLPFCVLPKVE